MKNRGFQEVYQIAGGIVRYGEKYGDDALWDGSLHIFDNRMSMNFSDHTKVIGNCDECGAPNDTFYDQHHKLVRKMALLCEICAKASGATTPTMDAELVG